MSKKIGFFSNINTNNAVAPTVPVFNVTAQLSNVAFPDVPDTITFDIDSTLTPAANTVNVYWSTIGASNADFTDNVITGNVFLDTSGNATVVRQITLIDTGTDGNITFEFRTGDPVLGNVILTQTVDISSKRFAPFTRYRGANVTTSSVDKSLIYYNQFESTNDQGELLYTDNAIRLELLPGDKLEIHSIQSPSSNTEITDVEILTVNFGGTSGYYGMDIYDDGNTSITSQGGGPGGHVVHATNQTLVANTYIVVDRITTRSLTNYGKAEIGIGANYTSFNQITGLGLIDTGKLPVYNQAEAANANASVGDFAIVLNPTNPPYWADVLRYNGSSWVGPAPGAEQDAQKNALANALVVSRAWTVPNLSTGGTGDFRGAGRNLYGQNTVPAEGGGGGNAVDTVQTTSIPPIVNNVIQTAYTSGTGSATHNGAGGAGQGGNGSDPDATAGGDGGAGYVSDIRGFGNVQYGAGGAGANGANVGVTYSATNFRRWNPSTQEYETVTAYPPGTGQQGYGNVNTRVTFNEYSPTVNDVLANQGRIYLKWRDFRRFLTL